MHYLRKKRKFLDALQDTLRKDIVLKNRIKKITTIAGVDVSYDGQRAKACVCVLKAKNLKLVETKTYISKVFLPYIPGYLSFREAPVMLGAIRALKNKPSCFMIDGNGILHPKQMGLATFLGVILKQPTVGCAKSLLLGSYTAPARCKGKFSYIHYKQRLLGAALRTRTDTNVVYVSPGWGVTLKKAIGIALSVSYYRIPEPLRLAHLYSKF